MDRTSKILAMARKANQRREGHTLNFLQIPRYESTKGLEAHEIDILLNCRQLFNEHRNTDNGLMTPVVKDDVQIEEISSTDRKYVTRLHNEEIKRNLFSETSNGENIQNFNEITSNVDDGTDDYDCDLSEDSGDDYIPDSEISESETDNESTSSTEKRTDGVRNISGPVLNQSVDVQRKVLKPKENVNKRLWNKKDHCYFCDTDVLKFSRHVIRHHQSEFEVQKILSLNVGDKRRKHLFTKLRNQGNFLISTVNDNIVPVRKPVIMHEGEPTASTYLPCKYCKGFYKKKFLYRHVKKCPHNNDEPINRINAQSEGQSLFATYKNNDVLRKDIFPTMRADAISFTAKTDNLICSVARRYLKSHREKQFRQVASRKMRQLAALLIEIKKKTKVRNLLEALNPVNFDIIVECTKVISKYDATTGTYGAPSLASHMGTELKDCIDVAYNMSLKKYHNENDETNKLKVLKELIINEWRYEISTTANNDLHMKRWNKPSLIPIAEDLTLLKSYLITQSEKSRNVLKQNFTDRVSFINLVEVTYVQLLLLNRRRVGELQRMTVNSYNTNIKNSTPNEFDTCISESEKLLMKSFKRIVIRGKRGRGVPVLFTEQMTKNTDLLLQHRKNFVEPQNIYLFPNINSINSINGSKAIYKHVRAAGVKNPAALTSTKLRKHLATMSQIINLSEQDLEQLANFMGHTSDIHKTYYRLPNDVYQMAKVSKLLLLNERGEATKFKGKSLDEINIDLDAVEEDDSDDDSNEVSEMHEFEEVTTNNVNTDNQKKGKKNSSTNSGSVTVESESSNYNSATTSGRKTKRILQPWTENQKKSALSFFKKHIKSKVAPKKKECLELKEKNPELFQNKSWEKIKIFIVNIYNKKS